MGYQTRLATIEIQEDVEIFKSGQSHHVWRSCFTVRVISNQNFSGVLTCSNGHFRRFILNFLNPLECGAQ